MTQQEHANQFVTEKEELKDLIRENEGPDLVESMLKDRRDWIQDVRAQKAGKVPDDLKDFYSRFNVEAPLSPEEEEQKRLDDEEAAKAKKKKKGEKKKEKKKKGKKGKDDDEDPTKNLAMIGPSEVVQKFDEFHKDYNEEWAPKDESDNFN